MDDLGRQLRRVNLNFLPVLQALLRQRSVTAAARELNMTQSGVSNTLKLLRQHFNDELLVRSGGQLRLTSKAQKLSVPLDIAMTSIGRVLASEPFDARTSDARFRIATADYVSAILAPSVAAALENDAPYMRAQFAAARGRSGHDLQSGDVDLIIGPRQILESITPQVPALARSLSIETIGSEPLVCVARSDNDAAHHEMSAAEYLSHPHASFHLDASAHASLEQSFLIEHDLEQFERILASDFLVLPMIAAVTNCIALVPISIARISSSSLPIKTFAPPLEIPNLELAYMWHKRSASDPAHEWFRILVKRCVTEITSRSEEI